MGNGNPTHTASCGCIYMNGKRVSACNDHGTNPKHRK